MLIFGTFFFIKRDQFEDKVHQTPHIAALASFNGPITSNHKDALQTSSVLFFNDNCTHKVHIIFDGRAMGVYLDDSKEAVLFFGVDIHKLGLGECWMGFTAATGAFEEEHIIESWYLRNSFIKWSAENHHHCSEEFKKRVKCFVLCLRRARVNLPKYIKYEIIKLSLK